MLMKPDPGLVAEQAALPAHTPAKTRAAEPFPATTKGSSAPSEPEVAAQPEDERVTVLLPPPPVTYKFVSFMRDTPHDRQIISTSRQGLAEYRDTYREPQGGAHPLRIRKAHHSGLPAFLTGFLEADEVPPTLAEPQQAATDWLQHEIHARALLGTELPEIEERLRYIGDSRIVQRQRQDEEERVETPLRDRQATTMVHARFQQWHQRWPVFGSQVVVHMAGGDPRMSVSSSYFPLSPEVDFIPQITSAQAEGIARQALIGYLEGPDAIDLLWGMLAPTLAAVDRDEPTAVEGLRPLDARVSDRLSLLLLAHGKEHAPELAARIASARSGTQDDLLALLHELWSERDEYGLTEWEPNVVLYQGEEHFIYPFAGRYHLAYQIEFLTPARDDGWRVFVDAEEGTVLGRPERLLRHDQSYYADAANLLDHPEAPASLSEDELSEVATDIQPFMTLRFHGDQGGAPVSLQNIARKLLAATTPVEHEAINVAYHAWRIYRHFTDVCGIEETRLHSYTYTRNDDGGHVEITQSPPLEVIVGKVGDALEMGCLYADTQHPKVITFQTDTLGGDGLDAEAGHHVHTPSLDPEVIYHEVTHGLMWLLNRAPSDQPNASVPFGRALLEGYANYFARSLAARRDAASHLWARAAYRENDWGEEWSLSRNRQEPGEDLLPAPNLYPEWDTEGLPVYDVGMVWARALWDIRDLLGADWADPLALHAFEYVHGWVANFEIAAEGLIASARTLLTDNPQVEATVEAIVDIFAQRGILAEKGVQALCQADDGQGGPVLVVGTDAGLKHSSDGGQSWSDWVQPQGELGSAARGVVALASDGSTVYAATEMGVYEWDSDQPHNDWSPLGQFPVTETALSVLVADGDLYVGTARGIWRYDGNSWASWNPSGSFFTGVALKMAHMSLTADGQQHSICFVAAINDILFSERNAVPAWGNLGRIQIAESVQTAWFTSVAVVGNRVYAGTLSQGAFSQGMTYDPTGVPRPTEMPPSWSPLPVGTLGDAAVLCLAADGDQRLFAGTTAGLFEMDPTGGGGWSPIDIDSAALPPGTIVTVTSVLPADDRLLVGTAAHGLFLQHLGASGGITWDHFPDIGT